MKSKIMDSNVIEQHIDNPELFKQLVKKLTDIHIATKTLLYSSTKNEEEITKLEKSLTITKTLINIKLVDSLDIKFNEILNIELPVHNIAQLQNINISQYVGLLLLEIEAIKGLLDYKLYLTKQTTDSKNINKAVKNTTAMQEKLGSNLTTLSNNAEILNIAYQLIDNPNIELTKFKDADLLSYYGFSLFTLTKEAIKKQETYQQIENYREKLLELANIERTNEQDFIYQSAMFLSLHHKNPVDNSSTILLYIQHINYKEINSFELMSIRTMLDSLKTIFEPQKNIMIANIESIYKSKPDEKQINRITKSIDNITENIGYYIETIDIILLKDKLQDIIQHLLEIHENSIKPVRFISKEMLLSYNTKLQHVEAEIKQANNDFFDMPLYEFKLLLDHHPTINLGTEFNKISLNEYIKLLKVSLNHLSVIFTFKEYLNNDKNTKTLKTELSHRLYIDDQLSHFSTYFKFYYAEMMYIEEKYIKKSKSQHNTLLLNLLEASLKPQQNSILLLQNSPKDLLDIFSETLTYHYYLELYFQEIIHNGISNLHDQLNIFKQFDISFDQHDKSDTLIKLLHIVTYADSIINQLILLTIKYPNNITIYQHQLILTEIVHKCYVALKQSNNLTYLELDNNIKTLDNKIAELTNFIYENNAKEENIIYMSTQDKDHLNDFIPKLLNLRAKLITPVYSKEKSTNLMQILNKEINELNIYYQKYLRKFGNVAITNLPGIHANIKLPSNLSLEVYFEAIKLSINAYNIYNKFIAYYNDSLAKRPANAAILKETLINEVKKINAFKLQYGENYLAAISAEYFAIIGLLYKELKLDYQDEIIKTQNQYEANYQFLQALVKLQAHKISDEELTNVTDYYLTQAGSSNALIHLQYSFFMYNLCIIEQLIIKDDKYTKAFREELAKRDQKYTTLLQNVKNDSSIKLDISTLDEFKFAYNLLNNSKDLLNNLLANLPQDKDKDIILKEKQFLIEEALKHIKIFKIYKVFSYLYEKEKSLIAELEEITNSLNLSTKLKELKKLYTEISEIKLISEEDKANFAAKQNKFKQLTAEVNKLKLYEEERINKIAQGLEETSKKKTKKSKKQKPKNRKTSQQKKEAGNLENISHGKEEEFELVEESTILITELESKLEQEIADRGKFVIDEVTTEAEIVTISSIKTLSTRHNKGKKAKQKDNWKNKTISEIEEPSNEFTEQALAKQTSRAQAVTEILAKQQEKVLNETKSTQPMSAKKTIAAKDERKRSIMQPSNKTIEDKEILTNITILQPLQQPAKKQVKNFNDIYINTLLQQIVEQDYIIQHSLYVITAYNLHYLYQYLFDLKDKYLMDNEYFRSVDILCFESNRYGRFNISTQASELLLYLYLNRTLHYISHSNNSNLDNIDTTLQIFKSGLTHVLRRFISSVNIQILNSNDKALQEKLLKYGSDICQWVKYELEKKDLLQDIVCFTNIIKIENGLLYSFFQEGKNPYSAEDMYIYSDCLAGDLPLPSNLTILSYEKLLYPAKQYDISKN